MSADKRKEIAERHSHVDGNGNVCWRKQDVDLAMREYAALALEEAAAGLHHHFGATEVEGWLLARAAKERKG